MAGRPKQGIDYAGWSVNIFDGDTKIDKLLDAQGSDGFYIYFYLCQMAYKHDGYFYRWSYDDSATTARRLGCGIGSKTVENTVGLCLRIGLFDKPLFDRHGILTSRGIQRRFLAAIQGRRVKSVIANYWLLENEESNGLDLCASNSDFQQESDYLQVADGHLQLANNPKSKVKESKVKESKGKESKVKESMVTPARVSIPTFEQVLEVAKLNRCPEIAKPFFDYYAAAEWHDSEGKPVFSWQQKFQAWKMRYERQQKPKTGASKSWTELAEELDREEGLL